MRSGADRFRPNVIVSGARAAGVEDGWSRLTIGGTLFAQLGPTGRCSIPTTDPATGIRARDEEPRATLLRYRPTPYGRGVHGGPTFGIWLSTRVDDGRVLTTGDVCEPLGMHGML